MKLVCINNIDFENDLKYNHIYDIKYLTKNYVKIYLNSKKDYIFVSKSRFLNINEYRKLKINKLL